MNYAYEFCRILEPLEIVFGELGDDQKKVYYKQLGHYSESQLRGACEKLLDTHRYMRFPTIAEIIQNIEPEKLDEPGPDDWHLAEFCQRCRNTGLYLEGEVARACSCIHGRRKEAAFRLARQGKVINEKNIQRLQRRLPPPTPPIRGLREQGVGGIWHDTEQEHERWMARKRAELKEIKERLAKSDKPALPDELQRQILKQTIREVEEKRQERMAEQEPEDLGDDEIPF